VPELFKPSKDSASRAYYGMEWKEKIGMEYGMAQVWNGRFDGMEPNQIFHIPYLHILTWCY